MFTNVSSVCPTGFTTPHTSSLTLVFRYWESLFFLNWSIKKTSFTVALDSTAHKGFEKWFSDISWIWSAYLVDDRLLGFSPIFPHINILALRHSLHRGDLHSNEPEMYKRGLVFILIRFGHTRLRLFTAREALVSGTFPRKLMFFLFFVLVSSTFQRHGGDR